MPRTIVVPVDESESAALVLPFAVPLAEALDARLVFIHAVPDEILRTHAEMVLARVTSKVPKWLSRSSEVRVGDPAAMIAQVALEAHASFVAMVTEHQRSAGDRWLNGSVADEVLRRTTIPVLVVSADLTRRWREQEMCILVPLDGSALSETVLDPAVDFAKALQGTLLLMRATHTPQAAQVYLERVAQRLTERGIRVTVQVAGGDAAAEIARVAREQGVDLIAMTTHGRTGLARLATGSVATRILEEADWPMLLVRPAMLGEPHSEGAGSRLPLLVPPIPWLCG